MQEIEATLIICSEAPTEVVDSIAALSSIGGYSLQTLGSMFISDHYFDTASLELQKADYNLRFREFNSTPYLTMKGPRKDLGPGIVERREVEMPWSAEALNCICGELADGGIHLPGRSTTPSATDPQACLLALGLELVQHRQNQRQARNILGGEEYEDQVLAEVGIDSVAYHFDRRIIYHYEVEIEAKSAAGAALLPSLTQSLADAYPGILQHWDHGKLATGTAIETLLGSEGLGILCNDQHQVMPVAYPLIHHLLTQGGD